MKLDKTSGFKRNHLRSIQGLQQLLFRLLLIPIWVEKVNLTPLALLEKILSIWEEGVIMGLSAGILYDNLLEVDPTSRIWTYALAYGWVNKLLKHHLWQLLEEPRFCDRKRFQEGSLCTFIRAKRLLKSLDSWVHFGIPYRFVERPNKSFLHSGKRVRFKMLGEGLQIRFLDPFSPTWPPYLAAPLGNGLLPFSRITLGSCSLVWGLATLFRMNYIE